MERLASPITALAASYDVVVVGSGYGGGVAASRLARAGQNVCLLERGREIPVGAFPDRLLSGGRDLQVHSALGHAGSATGLYDLHMGDDINVLVGCGLGGTSLINANVALRPDDRVLDDPAWPAALQADDTLGEGYARALRMLAPVPYPNVEPLNKYAALKTAAEAMSAPFSPPPINVVFDRTVNRAGVDQPACTLCGDCCSGCNVGAKTTTVMSYLPDAVNHGARIFTEIEVSHVVRHGDGWRLHYAPVSLRRDVFAATGMFVDARVVVLAAGSLGSTEILLRSHQRGLAVSDRVGQRFTGNGDVLAFVYNNDVPIDGIGVGDPPRHIGPPVGPCISGLIDLRGTDDVRDGMVIEEGSIPAALAPLLPALFETGGNIFGQDSDHGFDDWIEERGRELDAAVGGAYEGAIRNTQTLLVMSHDDAGGRMRLDDDELRIDWPGVARQPGFARVGERLKQVAAATGGTYVQNPISSKLMGERLITVHPLGGCAMGTSGADGVVNHKLQVFDAAGGGDAVHDGLYVCDGAVLPTSAGVNPLLTITALAERAMAHMAADRGWQFDDAPKAGAPVRNGGRDPAGTEPPHGVSFTERMAGWIATGSHAADPDKATYRRASDAGVAAGTPADFVFSIVVDDVDAFITDPTHVAGLLGTVNLACLSPDPMTATNGEFNLFIADPNQVDARRMQYRATLNAADGRRYLFRGFKDIRNNPGFDMWGDTTTLYVDVSAADTPDTVLARGVLTIAVPDFLRQMRTMQATGTGDPVAAATTVARFGRFFAGQIYETFGGPFRPLLRFDPDAPPRRRRPLRTPPPELHTVTTADGLNLRLTRYHGGDKGPVMLVHGLGVSGLIFTIDTIETNLVEHLCAAGYDCWVYDFRASIDLPYANDIWSADDVARHDYQPALDVVRAATGAADVQMVVHCFGSTTFVMAMLLGLDGVRSILVSQIATDVIVPWFPQRTLAHLRLPMFLEALRIGRVDARASTADPWWLAGLDRAISVAYPIEAEERTRSATSNRITALYGQLYEHDQLNQATFEFGLPEMFGVANIKAFRHLARIARTTHIVDYDGNELYLPNIAKLALPMTFIHGAENVCFRPASTEKTVARLSAANGAGLYQRHVIPDYGHIDCIFGKDAVRDVYPHILEHLERT